MHSSVGSIASRFLESEAVASLTWRRIIAVGALTLCTALSAWVVIPLPGTPVPLTLQTFFVLAGAGLLGTGLATTSQMLYLVLGGIGLPWFAGGAVGAPVFFGPTGGYLVGFVLASALGGASLPKILADKSWALSVKLLLAEALILGCGAMWLAFSLHLSFAHALAIGVLPFLPGDSLKLAAAFVLSRRLGPRLAQRLRP